MREVVLVEVVQMVEVAKAADKARVAAAVAWEISGGKQEGVGWEAMAAAVAGRTA